MRRRSFAILALALSAALGGCDTIGPQAIYNGRPAYNEAIERTDNQQMFDVIVKNRYGESAGLMVVASVSANFKVKGSIDAQFGIGNGVNYAGNLVPLNTGAAYEESPTITYSPVAGKDFLAELFGHLPLEFAILMIQGGVKADQAAVMLLKSINGLRNPAYLDEEESTTDPRFLRVANLLGQLQSAELLSLVTDGKDSYIYIVADLDPNYSAIFDELASLLSLPKRPISGAAYRIPIHLGIGKPQGAEILVETRSVSELIKVASAAMEVPADQIQAGVVLPAPPLGLIGDLINIKSSKTEPSDVLVSSHIRGVWYYISNDDLTSKLYFRLLERLVNARIADTARQNKSGPILTLPVAR